MLRFTLVALAFTSLVVSLPATVRADDDDPIPPPFEPGPGYEGLLPAPALPPYYNRDQDTIPYGLQSVANTPVLHLGQSFRPSLSSIDWVAFIFQNTIQPSDPNPPGPGYLQVSLYTGINSSDGALSGRLGTTDVGSIPSETTSWVVFRFPESISLVPGSLYYLHVEQTGGYQSWIGIRAANIYSNGSSFAYFYDTVFNNPPQNLNWGGRDFHFAQGVIEPLLGDFDQDGDVDGRDFLTWQRNPDLGDLADWQTNYGAVPPLSATSTAIPEPSTLLLLILATAAGWVSRRTD